MGFVDGPKAIKYYNASMRQVCVSHNFQFPLPTSQTWPNTSATPPHKKPVQGEGESAPVGTDNVSDELDEMDTTDIHPESNAEDTKRKGTNGKGNDEMPDNRVRRSKRQKRTHDYCLLDDPWADRADTTSSKMANMTSAKRVYATSNEPSVAPDNPKDLHQAQESSDWPDWEKAVQAELDQLHKLATWELVDPPEGCTPITNKWVLTKKYDKDSNLQKYKARLVARSYSQQLGMDYNDTFSPVVHLKSIQTLLALAVTEDWEMQQMDVKGAYLNGTIKEQIYMKQPEGFDDGTGQVCHLIKSLYGLKQAGCEWNEELNKQLESLGWKPTMVDPCTYVRWKTDGVEVIAVWANDLLLFASDSDLMENMKLELKSVFEITDLGELAKIVGIEIKQDHAKKTIRISQKQLIKGILQREGLESAHPVAVPMNPSIQFQLSEGESKGKSNSYVSVIGSLMYLAIVTRPDIAYAVFRLRSYMANPMLSHWAAAKQVLRYLSGTQEQGITYRAEGTEPRKNRFYGYSDVSYANNDDATSISGYVFSMSRGTITWGSKKQTSVSLSSTESEYVVMADAAREVTWLQNLLEGLGRRQQGPTKLYRDDNGVLAIAKNPQYHKHTKHFDTQNHYIRQKVKELEIEIEYCPTAEMTADIFTKALPKPKFQLHRTELGFPAPA